MDESRTGYLTEEQITRALKVLPAFLKEQLGSTLVSATYEFGCNLHDDLLYRSMSVGTDWLARFIRDSLERGIVVPGQSDFRIRVGDGRLDILICHEGDIHLNGSDGDLISRLKQTEPYTSFDFVPNQI